MSHLPSCPWPSHSQEEEKDKADTPCANGFYSQANCVHFSRTLFDVFLFCCPWTLQAGCSHRLATPVLSSTLLADW